MASSSSFVNLQWRSSFSSHNANSCPTNVAQFRLKRLTQLGAGKPVKLLCVNCSSTKKEEKEEPIVLRAAVSGVTELLRVCSKDSSVQSSNETVNGSTIAPEDFVEALRADYAVSYFLTGDFNDALYAENCFFADPTVQFSGRDLYKRNLKLLVPFYEDPSLVLDDIQEVGDGESQFIQAFWKLRVYLKLPWKPFIAVDGSTKYELDANAKIVKHVESWNVTGLEAIGQLFKPSDRAFWRRPRSL
ncbi:unnamed protein product [Calypogeia fissa]